MKFADALTWSRIVLIAPITIFVLLDLRMWVLVLVVIAELTDFFDGRVARWTKTASKQGAAFDSRVDTAFSFFLIIWVFYLFPSLIQNYWIWALAIVTVKAAELIVAHWKINLYTGMHLYTQKVCALLAAALLPVLILFGVIQWYILVTIIITIYGQLESIIYLLKGGRDLDAKSMFSR